MPESRLIRLVIPRITPRWPFGGRGWLFGVGVGGRCGRVPHHHKPTGSTATYLMLNRRYTMTKPIPASVEAAFKLLPKAQADEARAAWTASFETPESEGVLALNPSALATLATKAGLQVITGAIEHQKPYLAMYMNASNKQSLNITIPDGVTVDRNDGSSKMKAGAFLNIAMTRKGDGGQVIELVKVKDSVAKHIRNYKALVSALEALQAAI